MTQKKIRIPSEYIKQIDDILGCFIQAKDEYLTLSDIAQYLKSKAIDIDSVRVDSIVRKLVDEGYLYSCDAEEIIKQGSKIIDKHPIKLYLITFDGVYLMEKNGYSTAVLHYDRQDRMERMIRAAAIWVAIGTMGLLVVEIIRLICDYVCVSAACSEVAVAIPY